MYELLIILSISIILFLFIRRLPKKGGGKSSNFSVNKRNFNFNWFSLKRKIKAFFRTWWSKIIVFIKSKISGSKTEERKKKYRIDISKSFSRAEEYFEDGDLEKAEKICLKLISIKPSDARFYFLLSQIYQKQDNNKEAALCLREAVKRKPDGFWYLELGELLTRLGKYRQAEESFRKAIEMNNTIAFRWSKLAQVLLEQDKKSQAMEAIERAIEIEPNNKGYQEIKDQVISS